MRQSSRILVEWICQEYGAGWNGTEVGVQELRRPCHGLGGPLYRQSEWGCISRDLKVLGTDFSQCIRKYKYDGGINMDFRQICSSDCVPRLGIGKPKSVEGAPKVFNGRIT